MKKIIIIIIVVAIIVAVIIWKMRVPKVSVLSVDWLTNRAKVQVKGQVFEITEQLALSVSTDYAVEFGRSYRQDINRIGPTSVVITKNGAIVEYLVRK